ncbi:hypothetical protein PIB30_051959 [Stylosanthes scabra]|uniref:Uncharacterized protein n=1 Tax=Stylosanthes scabra TaxID=79078 RepID=A0ABU6YIN2_9FABA|nr:hypothetical protein [Stylosanthes scabra]
MCRILPFEHRFVFCSSGTKRKFEFFCVVLRLNLLLVNGVGNEEEVGELSRFLNTHKKETRKRVRNWGGLKRTATAASSSRAVLICSSSCPSGSSVVASCSSGAVVVESCSSISNVVASCSCGSVALRFCSAVVLCLDVVADEPSSLLLLCPPLLLHRSTSAPSPVAAALPSVAAPPLSAHSSRLICSSSVKVLLLIFRRVYSLDWTSERNRIVSASQDGWLIVWNALTRQKIHAIKLPCARVMTTAFSPTGQSVACGGLNSVCSIFNLNSATDKDGNLPVSRMLSGQLSGHKGYISSCQYVLDEDTNLITGSGDQTCVLWDITTGLKTSIFGGEFQSGHTADVLRA